MRLTRGFALTVAITVAGSAFGLSAQGGQPAFALAMLRRDGVLVPFAVSDGKKWSSPWPVPKYQLEAPIAFSDIPKDWWGRAAPATTWTAWPTGGQPLAVHVTGPVVFNAHCLSNVGLRTDYRSSEPLPPIGQQHHPKDGVATTGNATVDAVAVLNDTAPEWSTTLEIIRTAVEKAESKAPDTDWWERTYGWRGQRAKIPLKLEVLCRSKGTAPGTVVYYFEAVREFPAVRPSLPIGGRAGRRDCGLHIFSQGFFVLDGKTLRYESITSTFTDCDRTDVDYGLPLGTIMVNGHVHWIMHWAGHGRERYTILEAGDKSFKRVVDVPGGAC